MPKIEGDATISDSCYRTAKVVILGDSGVGKTGLGFVLAGHPYTLTESTHTRRVWTFDKQAVEFPNGQGEIRETLLWDMAGQSSYRLLNQPHLDDVAVALIVFDAIRETDPFASIDYWNRILRQAEHTQNTSTVPMKKFLIAARMDRGDAGISTTHIDPIVRKLDFDDYFETSAKEGWKVAELSGAIRAAIDWNVLPCVRSAKVFQHIKTFLLSTREDDHLLLTISELYGMFLDFLNNTDNTLSTKGLWTEFEICINLVESQGLLQKFSFGNLILLRPELLDSYLSALVSTVRSDRQGLCSIAEERVRPGGFFLLEGERLRDKEKEKLLIIALIEDLLRREIVLREQGDDGSYLVFPSLTPREGPNMPDPEGKAIIFTFEGSVLNIYATLVMRLAHSGMFRKEQTRWKDAVTYRARTGGTCGLFLHNTSEESGEITLFFDQRASEETRFNFEEYVQIHLQRRALPESLKRRRIFSCHECGFVVAEQLLRLRTERGFNWLDCPVCSNRIIPLDREQRLAAPLSPHIVEMDRAADSQRDRETAKSIIQGKQTKRDFDVFLCSNGMDKPAIRKISNQLKERGVLPWLDEEQLRPGQGWQRVLERQVEQISAVAVFVGKDGFGPWQQMELDAFLRQFVRRGCPVIPVLLPEAPNEPNLPVFLLSMAWVDFRKQEPNPIDQLIWGITGRRPVELEPVDVLAQPSALLPQVQHDTAMRFRLSDTSNVSAFSPLQESDALWDINEIRLVVGDKSFRNYRRLARAIIRRMGITEFDMIEAPHFAYGTAWEITLPKEFRLQLSTRRVLLLLRQAEQESACYKDLMERTKDNALIFIMDIAKVPHTPLQISPRTLRFSPEKLIEMVETSADELPGWLGRFITTRLEKIVRLSILPYGTEGAVNTNLFYGREYELMLLTRLDRLGGIITGAHKSGKSSLLKQLATRISNKALKIIGPYELGSISFQTFFERTLDDLGLTSSPTMTPETWATLLRNFAKQGVKPIFLLDEVDDLILFDKQQSFALGRQLRSLHNENHCKFYLAGHAQLREACHLQYSPYQNFAKEFILTGVSEEAGKQLLQMPMSDIGFNISDEQVHRIFQGTDGVPFLIQDFCIRLLCNLSPGQESKFHIEDDAIEEVEQSPDYLESVFHYYKYSQTWASMSVMLIAAMRGKASRQNIITEFRKNSVPLSRIKLDNLLHFLTDFGILKVVEANHYTVRSKYLYEAIMTREPESLLDTLLTEKTLEE